MANRQSQKSSLTRLLLIGSSAILFVVLSGCARVPGQRLCENNDNPVATIGPCEGPTGTTITVTPGKQLPSAPGTLVFKRVVANGVPAQVITQISSNTVSSPPQLCMVENGRWEVWLSLANGQSQGKIGAFWTTGCVGGTSTGLGISPGTNNAPSPNELIILAPITINVDNEVYVKTKNTSQSYIKNIGSTVPEVATGTEWGTNDIKVRGKSPGTTTISFFDANTGTLYRIQVTVVRKGENPPPGGSGAAKSNAFDACLVGTWVATTVKPTSSFIDGGGDGFRVTFEQDGTQTVDYSTMKPFDFKPNQFGSRDSQTYSGTASARISTENSKAKIEQIIKAGAVLHGSKVNETPPMPMPGLGFAGLGDTSADNSYTCTRDSLEYQGSMHSDKRPNVKITLTRQGN
ncbi:MAG: hypothetical protein ACT4OT_14210 [Acidobacteriota bacterium]